MITTYNTETFAPLRTSKPTIRFDAHNGIYFSKTLAKSIGLESGGFISFKKQITGKDTDDWYICLDPKGFEVRGSLTMHNKAMAKLFLKENKIEEKSRSFVVSESLTELEDGTKGYCIIITK